MSHPKLPITSIDEQVHTTKGFDESGCYGCSCSDACCTYGCDVDHTARHTMIKYRVPLEDALGRTLENCFEGSRVLDKDYPGGSYERSKVEEGMCVFHEPSGKGCVLYRLSSQQNIPAEIIPAICRLYPITWSNGCLTVSPHQEPTCNVYCNSNTTTRTLYESQKGVISSLVQIEG